MIENALREGDQVLDCGREPAPKPSLRIRKSNPAGRFYPGKTTRMNFLIGSFARASRLTELQDTP